MKAYSRYQKGYLYEEHGAWYVRYRQRVPQEDGSSELKHISKHLGRSNDFSNIFAVERCRALFVRRMIRPALEAIDLPWHWWHAFRRGLASNLYAMGASDKVVQRIAPLETARYQGTLY